MTYTTDELAILLAAKGKEHRDAFERGNLLVAATALADIYDMGAKNQRELTAKQLRAKSWG